MTITAQSPRHHISVPVFASPLVRVGRWRCPADHPIFADSGPTAEALFVFPRESVWIRHAGREPFVADANTVTYYNKGQSYTRQKLSVRGDHCEWFAVAPEAIAETLSAHDPSAADRPDRPFTFTHGPSDPDSYLRQRMVFEHVSHEQHADRLFVEEAVLSILGDVTRLAYARQGHRPAARARQRRDVDLVEAARDVIARNFKDNLSLSDIAREVESSVFHFARIFKARTGFRCTRTAINCACAPRWSGWPSPASISSTSRSTSASPATVISRKRSGEVLGKPRRPFARRSDYLPVCVGAAGSLGSVSHQNCLGNGFCCGHTMFNVSPSYSSPFFIT